VLASSSSEAVSGNPPGDLFSGTPYRVVRPLGKGGMGEVFLVEHQEVGRQLVAKMLHRRFAGDPQLLDRVRLEAHTLGLLEDPNVVQVVDFRETRDGVPFLVMEYLIGRTLKADLSTRGALPLLDALDFADQALSGLGAAHALGIVHRDIKPENLFLSEETDGALTLKVIDFGLARVVPGVSEQGPRPLVVPTETGAVLGSPRYLSPEAALGRRGIDHRADLYSLALVLYEMVAGRGPFDHLENDFLTAHSVEDPAPPSQYAKRPIPAELDALILRGLRKNPAERYQTAQEFQRELELLWKLLHNSQALATRVFSLSEGSVVRTTGKLRKQTGQGSASAAHSHSGHAAAAAAPGVARSTDSMLQPSSHARTRPALLVASLLVGLITAIAVTGAVFALMARFAP